MTTPICPVIRDSTSCLWRAVADGVVVSADLTNSGHLRPSLIAVPEDDVWPAAVAASSPFGKQQSPDHSTSTAPNAPLRMTRHVARRGDIERDILRRELEYEDDTQRPARRAMLRRANELIERVH